MSAPNSTGMSDDAADSPEASARGGQHRRLARSTLIFSVATGLSSILGPRKPTPEKSAPYECGMPPVGDARERQSVKFYLVAMIFLLFDIEVAFLYPWAMALRDLGWAGFVQVVLFMTLLLAGYVYVWRKGVLDWGQN